MPILIPKGLPAYKTLKEENVFVMNEQRASTQDIRPLRIAIVNLMPTKEVTETQLIRMLANTPLQVDLQLLTMDSHDSKNTDKLHLDNFYKTFDEIKNQRFDGMIITGAPVEFLPFEEVDYWKELSEILEYTKTNVFSTLHICWGAQAALYYHYGINKFIMPEKLFGVFKHELKDKKSELTRGFDEEFYAPHSRHTQIRKEDIQKIHELKILAESETTGPHIISTRDKRRIFVQGHMEYDRETLKLEYERDINKGLKIDVPKDYFKEDNPSKGIVVKWSGNGNLFFANWLNYIYQETPYDLRKLDDLNKKIEQLEATMEICKHNEGCGGCIYQEIPYQDQIILKGKEVIRLLEEKKINYEKYLGIEGSPKRTAYRNKMEYTFGDEIKNGEMTLGMHKKGRFMSVVTVDECQLVDSDFNEILKATLNFCTEKGYDYYHKKSHLGLMRNLIIRKGEHTGELLVNAVTSSQREFDGEKFAEMIRALPLQNKIVGILHTVNDNVADFVYCDKLHIIWGRDYYMEEIMTLKFKVSAFSFFQTNILAVEKLYTEAISLIKDLDGKTVFDLYCGTGTITQTLALRAKKAIGVDIVEEAVEAAKENSRMNGLSNCEFIAGDVLEVLDQLDDAPDVIVLDPPRVGIHPKALEKILNYGVKQIVYISCNPKSLVENLSFMQYYGYQLKSIKAFDNFPYTKHIECVCLIELK